ncbi:hypothetical protein QFZ48_000439 [Chitinophaga sp. W2I13]
MIACNQMKSRKVMQLSKIWVYPLNSDTCLLLLLFISLRRIEYKDKKQNRTNFKSN